MSTQRFKPLCPICAAPMRFVRSLPGIGALPELHTFECEACAEVMTAATDELMQVAEAAPAWRAAP